MARVIGGLTTSHIPAIGNAVPREKELVDDPYWKPFFAAYPPARTWLQKVKPDVAVVIYNDHGRNCFLDNLPTLAIGAAAEYRFSHEGWGHPDDSTFPGRSRAFLAHHRIASPRRIRHYLLPGDVRRSWLYRSHVAVLAEQLLWRD